MLGYPLGLIHASLIAAYDGHRYFLIHSLGASLTDAHATKIQEATSGIALGNRANLDAYQNFLKKNNIATVPPPIGNFDGNIAIALKDPKEAPIGIYYCYAKKGH